MFSHQDAQLVTCEASTIEHPRSPSCECPVAAWREVPTVAQLDRIVEDYIDRESDSGLGL